VWVLGVKGAVCALIKTLTNPEELSREMLSMTYASLGPAVKRGAVASLAEKLERLVALAHGELVEPRAALKGTPPALEDDDDAKNERSAA
jgi:hypothetical protein